MTWVVLKFVDSEEVEVVPVQWFNTETEICLYLPFSRTMLERAIKQKLEPPILAVEEGWKKYKAKLMSDKQYGNFLLANAKASKACLVSDVSDKEDTLPTKRISKKNILYSDTSDCNSDESDSTLTNLPKPPFGTETASCQKTPIENRQGIKQNDDNGKKPRQKTLTENYQRNKQKADDSRTTKTLTENGSKKTMEKDDTTTEIASNVNLDTYQKEMIRYAVFNKKMLEDITKKLINLQVDVDYLKSVHAEPRPENKNIVDSVYSTLPIKDDGEIPALEEKLKEAAIYDSLVNNLAQLGGLTYKECCRRFLSKLILDDIAILYTLHGHRDGKKAFGDSILCNAIIDAVKKNNTEVTSKQIEIQIGLWLTKAKERNTKTTKNQQSLE